MIRKLVVAASIALTFASGASAQPAIGALGLQQQKVSNLAKEFFSANDALEARLDDVVSTLTSLRDSPKSGTQVADAKADAVQSLKASVDKYRTQRLKIEDQLRQSSSAWDPETLKRVETFIDGRLQKRVGQIMELVNSVEGSAGSSETSTVLREDGWGNIREVEDTSSKEYKQGEKLDKRATQIQKDTREDIEKRITALKSQISTLKSQSAATADPTRKAELERQVAGYESRLAVAQKALSNVGQTNDESETQTVGSAAEGHKLDLKLREVTSQMQTEQRKVDMLGAQLMNELARLDSLKAPAAQR